MRRRVYPPFVQYAIVLGLIVAAVLAEGRFGFHFTFHDARPDLGIVVTGSASALLGWRRGAVFGLVNGLLSAALFPVNFGTQIISSILGGLAAGWISDIVSIDSPLIAPLAGLFCSATVGISSIIMAPSHSIHKLLLHLFVTLAMNTILTIPTFYGLKVLRIGSKQQESLFGG